MERALLDVEPTPDNYTMFVQAVKKTACACIPRGCRKEYIAGLTEESLQLLESYETEFGNDPFSDTTSELGDALTESLAEYACPAWSRSCHACKLDPILNETCRIVTGCIKTTPVQCLYALSGIAPPDIRRTVITKAERTKQAIDNRHLLHEHSAVRKRLGSRSSFLDTSETLETTPTDARTTEWQKQWNSLGSQAAQWKERGITPDECLATGHDQPWAVWKTLNRLRVGEGRCKASMKKWNITTSDACACGEPQTMEHLMNCTQAPQCTGDDLAEPTAAALACANHWKDEI
ncbi:hypothetical protein AAFF_G00326200 [Aldrovandia affinis]|uniref:Uncharacterized protein n=1 Tax=Aldrovandia affinis TaxID=143900 RepID=A0AAD7X198_9TELE|nr:hypothetical protein AAFF_G00326200 [Aldrovandia affinis]